MIDEATKNKLEDFLACYPQTISIDKVCGLFYGIAITPALINPSEWLPVVFDGEVPEFGTAEEAKKATDILIDAYNQLITHYRNGSLAFPHNYQELEGEDFVQIEDWSAGCIQGIQLRTSVWAPSTRAEDMDEDEDEIFSCLSIIYACSDPEQAHQVFDHKGSSDPRIREEGFGESELFIKIFGILPHAVNTLTKMGAALATRNPNFVSPTSHIRTEKVGGNQPCPCGSGKKYKHCCIGAEEISPTIH